MGRLKTVFGVFQFLLILGLYAGGYYLWTQISSQQTSTPVAASLPSTEKVIKESVITEGECDADCIALIDEKVADAVASAVADLPTSGTTTTVVSSAPKTSQTSYVPLGTTSSTTSTDWYTVEDSSAFIDLANDFSKDAYVTFEGSLKVAYGNGQAFARLWDDTNKIAVNGSEISSTGNSDYEYMKSGRIYLWNGNNNYKIQIKSLNGYEATFTNGKVKLVY